MTFFDWFFSLLKSYSLSTPSVSLMCDIETERGYTSREPIESFEADFNLGSTSYFGSTRCFSAEGGLILADE